MSALDDWVEAQWASMRHGVKDIATDAVSDIGNTYQAFLMADAGWRLPRAGRYDLDDQDIAVAAALEEQQEYEAPGEPVSGLDYA